MICPDCYGIGEMLVDRDLRPVARLRDAVTMIPCPSCGGSGVASCCDGACGGPGEIMNGEGDA